MMKRKIIKGLLSVFVLTAPLFMATGSLAEVRKFYDFRPLSNFSPESTGKSPQDFGIELPPVPRSVIEKAVRDFFASWNTPGFASMLAPEFVDASRLLDAINDTVPRDARVRVQSIGAVSTLADVIEELADGQGFDRIVTVSATVNTAVEFTNSNGFQRLEGTNDYVFKIREQYR